jgi:putative FmdB family regulatory protein
MPIYEYACKTCGHRVEVLHGIHATGPATCDVCGGPMTKLVSAPAIVFKGSGWAKKDARDRSASRTSTDGKKPDAGAAEPAAAGGAGSNAGSSAGTDSSKDAKSSSAATPGAGGTRGRDRDARSSGRDASGAAAPQSRKSGDR